uniref:Uncharacterized protein LOC114329985 n=1 Tax=Diabrotica virgifera virgifera TaxID=50390 RepID=A0A6P7FGQ5_DIAVI
MPNERFAKRVSSEIDNALLNFLQQKKKGDTIKKRKKKLLNAEPGQSVQFEEIGQNQEGSANEDLEEEIEMETSDNENLAEEMEMTNSDDDIGGEAGELHEAEQDEIVENIESDENVEVDGNILKIGTFVVVQLLTKKPLNISSEL